MRRYIAGRARESVTRTLLDRGKDLAREGLDGAKRVDEVATSAP